MAIKTWIALAGLLAAIVLVGSMPGRSRRPELRDARDKVSYAFGMEAGPSLQKNFGPLEIGVVARGIKDGLSGRTLKLAADELQKTLRDAAQAQQIEGANGEKSRSLLGKFFGSFGSEREKRSYAAGANLGKIWRLMNADLDPDRVALGIGDAWSGYTAVMTEAEAHAETARFGREWQLRQAEERRKLGEKNRAEGSAFLARNRLQKGVSVLPGGLQYKVLCEGAGSSPAFDRFVMINYRGAKIDGTVFEDSKNYPKPVIAPIGGIMRGWADALQAMKPGAKWQIYLSPEDAYGADGNGTVGPNETVIFDLELVKILPSGREPVGTD